MVILALSRHLKENSYFRMDVAAVTELSTFLSLPSLFVNLFSRFQTTQNRTEKSRLLLLLWSWVFNTFLSASVMIMPGEMIAVRARFENWTNVFLFSFEIEHQLQTECEQIGKSPSRWSLVLAKRDVSQSVTFISKRIIIISRRVPKREAHYHSLLFCFLLLRYCTEPMAMIVDYLQLSSEQSL